MQIPLFRHREEIARIFDEAVEHFSAEQDTEEVAIRLKAIVIGDSLKLNGVSKNNGGIE